MKQQDFNELADSIRQAGKIKRSQMAGSRQSLDNTLLERVTANPDILGGKPIIRGSRIPVELILGLLAQGASESEILDDYPDLQPDDIRAAIAYAKAVIAGDSLEAVRA